MRGGSHRIGNPKGPRPESCCQALVVGTINRDMDDPTSDWKNGGSGSVERGGSTGTHFGPTVPAVVEKKVVVVGNKNSPGCIDGFCPSGSQSNISPQSEIVGPQDRIGPTAIRKKTLADIRKIFCPLTGVIPQFGPIEKLGVNADLQRGSIKRDPQTLDPGGFCRLTHGQNDARHPATSSKQRHRGFDDAANTSGSEMIVRNNECPVHKG